MLGKRIRPNTEEIETCFPSFELLTEDVANTVQHSESLPSTKLQAVDPLLHMALDQCGADFLDSDNITMNSQKLTNEFIPSSSLPLDEDQNTQQVIFANAFENDFYNRLINNKQEFSPRIF